MSKITILGTGAMGSRIAKNLIEAGHEVTVWNRTREKTEDLKTAGAKIANTPAQAAEGADFAISMVRDDDASREVWLNKKNGALKALPETAIAIESSTVTLAWARKLAAACNTRNIRFLDAPVAGSRPQADAGQLIYLVGGAPDTLAQTEPILKTMGAAVHHAGDAPGSGTTVKLAVNALFGVQIAAVGELLGFLKNCGLDVDRAFEIITATPVCSPAAKAAGAAMLSGNFAPMFPVELVEKDFGYVAETAVQNQSETPMANAAHRILNEAIDEGYGEENLTSVVKLYLK